MLTERRNNPAVPRILLRLDATHETGLAHAVRMRNLLSALRTQHHLSVIGQGSLIKEFFPGAQCYICDEGDSHTLQQVVKCSKPSVLMVDCPGLTPDDWAWYRKIVSVPSIAIDDFGGAVRADLVINGTVLPGYHHYPCLPAGAAVLAGPDYALLHPSFALNPWNPHKGSLPRITIVAGGGRRAVEWARTLCAGRIDFSHWGHVHLVVGKSFPDGAEMKRLAGARGVRFHQALGSSELAGLLATSSAALVTGGMVVYECLASGVPTVVFPQLRNLTAEAEWFADHGCAVNLGYEGGMSLAAVNDAVEAVLSDESHAAALSTRARQIIDGQGIQRIAEVIDGYGVFSAHRLRDAAGERVQ